MLGDIEVDVDHLDHVPSEDRQMLLSHGLHRTLLIRANERHRQALPDCRRAFRPEPAREPSDHSDVESSQSRAGGWRYEHGSAGGRNDAGRAALRNIGGSFYDFTAELYRGTSTETLSAPPDAWGGRAAAEWAQRLGSDSRYDPPADRLVDVARVLDMIYRQ
jgi:hypothetical protein